MRQGIVHHLLTAAMSQSRIIINNLGETIRDFLYIDDFIRAVYLLTERPLEELIVIFNISSNIKTSINQIIGLLSFEFPQIYEFIEINDQPDEIPENVLDNSKFRNVFPNWVPLTLAEGIKITIHWNKP
jgi:UDP-glucose 4-epimerase